MRICDCATFKDFSHPYRVGPASRWCNIIIFSATGAVRLLQVNGCCNLQLKVAEESLFMANSVGPIQI